VFSIADKALSPERPFQLGRSMPLSRPTKTTTSFLIIIEFTIVKSHKRTK
jgi:hypothetical protein